MANLLKETIEVLQDNQKNPEDVMWVGNSTHKFSWEQFKSKANVNYDAGFGSPKVADDLLVVGNNWWLERHEYDGSEWWKFKQMPKTPELDLDVKALTIGQAENLGIDVSCGWEGLLDINGINTEK